MPRILAALVVAVVLGLIAFSPSFGRAVPAGNYRPPLPEDALTNGCWPLPGNARLGFGYQVRTDTIQVTSQGPRRVLALHFDEIGLREARHEVLEAFDAVGRSGAVVVRGSEFENLTADDVVRGELVLWLPPSQPRADRADCAEVYSTKQFVTTTGGLV